MLASTVYSTSTSQPHMNVCLLLLFHRSDCWPPAIFSVCLCVKWLAKIYIKPMSNHERRRCFTCWAQQCTSEQLLPVKVGEATDSRALSIFDCPLRRHDMKQAQIWLHVFPLMGILTGTWRTGQAASSTSETLHGRWPEQMYSRPFDWAPCSPDDGLSHYLLVSSRLVACHHGDSLSTKDKVHCFRLPAPPDAWLPLTITCLACMVLGCNTAAPSRLRL